MQTLGTQWRDMIDKRLWARITRRRITRLIEEGTTKIVIDDMRFPHEADMMREIGAEVIAVRRPAMEPTRFERVWSRLPLPVIVRPLARVAFGIRSFHRSETDWFRIVPDEIIWNDGTLAELYNDLDGIVA